MIGLLSLIPAVVLLVFAAAILWLAGVAVRGRQHRWLAGIAAVLLACVLLYPGMQSVTVEYLCRTEGGATVFTSADQWTPPRDETNAWVRRHDERIGPRDWRHFPGPGLALESRVSDRALGVTQLTYSWIDLQSSNELAHVISFHSGSMGQSLSSYGRAGCSNTAYAYVERRYTSKARGSRPEPANPSIERTANGGSRLRAPSPLVAPSAAAHVQR